MRRLSPFAGLALVTVLVLVSAGPVGAKGSPYERGEVRGSGLRNPMVVPNRYPPSPSQVGPVSAVHRSHVDDLSRRNEADRVRLSVRIKVNQHSPTVFEVIDQLVPRTSVRLRGHEAGTTTQPAWWSCCRKEDSHLLAMEGRTGFGTGSGRPNPSIDCPHAEGQQIQSRRAASA